MKVMFQILILSFVIFVSIDTIASADTENEKFNYVLNRSSGVCGRLKDIYNKELDQFSLEDFDRHPNFIRMAKTTYGSRNETFFEGLYSVDIDINNDGQKETVNRLVLVQGNRPSYLTDRVYVYFPGHPYTRSHSKKFHDYHLNHTKRNKDYIGFEDVLSFKNFPVSFHDAPRDTRVENRISGVKVTKHGRAYTHAGQSIFTYGCVNTLPFIHEKRNFFVVNSCITRNRPPQYVLLLSYLRDKRIDVLCYLRRGSTGRNGKPR